MTDNAAYTECFSFLFKEKETYFWKTEVLTECNIYLVRPLAETLQSVISWYTIFLELMYILMKP